MHTIFQLLYSQNMYKVYWNKKVDFVNWPHMYVAHRDMSAAVHYADYFVRELIILLGVLPSRHILW